MWNPVVLLLALPSPPADDPLEGLAAKLCASDKWTRAEAVEELARVGTDAAWELLLPMLADKRGEVADAAQLALAGATSAKVQEWLAREQGLKSEEPLVRARVAEALGRMQAPPAKLLARALGDDDPEVRRMAAWSLERLAAGGKLPAEARAGFVTELARAARGERDPLGRVRALAALRVLDPKVARGAIDEACRDRLALVRGAATRLLEPSFLSDEALQRLRPALVDESFAVRRLAVEAVGELGTRSAATLLVERLGKEGEERLLVREVELLQALSGLKHRRDVRPWHDWLAQLPDDWRATPRRAARDEAVAERSSAALAGLPIVSKRIAILIDLSGSIWNVRPDGKTKKEVVDGKLREALESLPPDTRFNLIPYTGKPIPWKERLAPATPATVRMAAKWFEDRRENGSGNFWDAAMLALQDPEVDTLLVLFDGAPTGGHRHRLELLAPLFLEQNLGRGVTLDLVLVDASKKLQRLWGELAEATGGRTVSVSF